ncbi:hypothetical protein K440DRAFT_657729 [Wilcoxina mikolae CBS 423.85]|nr:hypothetical protein K440DRAFT_657729 [Wilcoxina mikolae CBS 423.85]
MSSRTNPIISSPGVSPDNLPSSTLQPTSVKVTVTTTAATYNNDLCHLNPGHPSITATTMDNTVPSTIQSTAVISSRPAISSTAPNTNDFGQSAVTAVTDDNLRHLESTGNYAMLEWLGQAAKDDAVTAYTRDSF